MDSKDLSSGMSSPPLTFVEPDFLTAAKSLLTEDGACISHSALLHLYSRTSNDALGIAVWSITVRLSSLGGSKYATSIGKFQY